MHYIFKSFPVLFLTVLYGVTEMAFLDFLVYGSGEAPPRDLEPLDIALNLGITPILIYCFLFLGYNVVTRLSTKIAFVTVLIYFFIFEIGIIVGSDEVQKFIVMHFNVWGESGETD